MAGFTRLKLTIGTKQSTEKGYVVRKLSTPLLGLPAIVALGLLIHFGAVNMETLKAHFPKLCRGLGEVQQPYTIKLKPGAVPFSLKTPRRIPLLGKVKEELQHMEKLGVIRRVEEPTDWFADMVIVPKKDTADTVTLTSKIEHVLRGARINGEHQHLCGLHS